MRLLLCLLFLFSVSCNADEKNASSDPKSSEKAHAVTSEKNKSLIASDTSNTSKKNAPKSSSSKSESKEITSNTSSPTSSPASTETPPSSSKGNNHKTNSDSKEKPASLPTKSDQNRKDQKDYLDDPYGENKQETNNPNETPGFNPNYEDTFMKTILVLIAILALVGLVVWMIRRMSGSKFKQMNYLKTIKILEKRPISPKSILYLIEFNGKQILISESQLEVRSLSSTNWMEVDKDL